MFNRKISKYLISIALLLLVITSFSGLIKAETKSYSIAPGTNEYCTINAEKGDKIKYTFEIKDDNDPRINVYLLNQTNYENMVNLKDFSRINEASENKVRLKTVNYEVKDSTEYYIIMENPNNKTVNVELEYEVVSNNIAILFQPIAYISYGFIACLLIIYVLVPVLKTF